MGRFRIHKLLAKKVREYGPLSTNIEINVTINTVEMNRENKEMIQVGLKCPKESRRASMKVELFANATKS